MKNIFDDKTTLIYKNAKELETPINYIYEENGVYDTIANYILNNFENELINIYNYLKERNNLLDVYKFVYVWLYVINNNENKNFTSYQLNKINEFLLILNFSDFDNIEILNNAYNDWINNYSLEIKRDEQILKNINKYQKDLNEIKPYKIKDITITGKNSIFSFKDQNGLDINILDGIEIFDTSIPNMDVPFIRYNNSKNHSIYKIYENIDKEVIENIEKSNSKFLKPDSILLIICVNNEEQEIDEEGEEIDFIKRKKIYDYCFFELKTGKVTINSTNDENYILNIKEKILWTLPFIKLEYLNEEKLKGFFIIENIQISEACLHYLIINDKLFSNYLFIEEEDKAYADKKIYNIHYKTGETGQVGTNFEKKSSISVNFEYLENESDFNKIKIKEEKFLKVYFIKVESKESLSVFLEIFSRIITIYKHKLKDTAIYINNLIPSSCRDILYPNEENKEKTKKISKKTYNKEVNYHKRENLTDKAPDLFIIGTEDKSYVKKCSCKLQPLIIKDDEISDWENHKYYKDGNEYKRQILKLNDFNFVCPDDRFPHPIAIEYNKTFEVDDELFSKKSYYPCCRVKSDNNEKNEKKTEHYSNYRVSANKIVKNTRANGKLHKMIIDLLRSDIIFANNDFIREGTNKSTSSIIHCILNSLIDKTYIKLKTNEEKEDYVQNIRRNIAEKISPNIYKQEMYDSNEKQIKEMILNMETDLDPYLFYRGLEEYFDINIFVFNTFASNNPVLEIPRCKLCHIRINRINRKSVLILKHIEYLNRKFMTIHCELIISKGKIINNMENTNVPRVVSKGETIFGQEMTNKLFNILNDSFKTFTVNINDQVIYRNSPFSIVNWKEFFKSKNLEITAQQIDYYGKMVVLEINKEFTILIPPSQPLDLPVIKNYLFSDLNTIQKKFGEFVEIDKNGVWYQLLDIKNGLFILCKNENLNKDLVIKDSLFELQIDLDANKSNLLNNIFELKNCKKLTSILMQIINWIWKTSIKKKGKLMDINTFIKKFINLDNSTKNEKYFEPQKINRILENVENVEDCFKFINWHPYFKNGKINLYKELYHNVCRFFKREYILIKGLKLTNEYNSIPSRIQDFYFHESDFKKIENSIIFLNDNFMKKWIEQKNNSINLNYKNLLKSTKKLSIDLYNMDEPYIYKDTISENNETGTGKIYIIQNVYAGEIKRALNVCKIWKEQLINQGLNTEEIIEDLTDIQYVVYGISKNNSLIPIENKTKNLHNSEYFFQILKYTSEGNKYAALLPIL